MEGDTYPWANNGERQSFCITIHASETHTAIHTGDSCGRIPVESHRAWIIVFVTGSFRTVESWWTLGSQSNLSGGFTVMPFNACLAFTDMLQASEFIVCAVWTVLWVCILRRKIRKIKSYTLAVHNKGIKKIQIYSRRFF